MTRITALRIGVLLVTTTNVVRSFISLPTSSVLVPSQRKLNQNKHLLRSTGSDKRSDSDSPNGVDNFRNKFRDAADEGFGTKAKNVFSTMTVGDTIVPICGNLALRQILANKGVYAGVEYEVCTLTLPDGTQLESMKDVANEKQREDIAAEIKPAYKLRDYLERNDWPVKVKPVEVPLWLSKTTYEAGTLVGTLSVSAFYITIAAVLALFVRFAYVPSPSMQPALNPGNVVFVTRSIWPMTPSIGDVILFDPPASLNAAIASSSVAQENGATLPTKGQKFLKRVVAKDQELVGVKNGNIVVDVSSNTSSKQGNEAIVDDEFESQPKKFRVDVVGPYAQPDVFPSSSWDRPVEPLRKNELFVAGDNGFRSVDSRVWGGLPNKKVFGVARWVMWPLNDFGPIDSVGQISYINKSN